MCWELPAAPGTVSQHKAHSWKPLHALLPQSMHRGPVALWHCPCVWGVSSSRCVCPGGCHALPGEHQPTATPPAVPASQQHGADKESCTHSVGGLVVPLCELGVGVASRALGGHLHAGPAAVVTAPALRGHNGTVSGLAKELPGLRIQSLKLMTFHSPAVSRDTFH